MSVYPKISGLWFKALPCHENPPPSQCRLTNLHVLHVGRHDCDYDTPSLRKDRSCRFENVTSLPWSVPTWLYRTFDAILIMLCSSATSSFPHNHMYLEFSIPSRWRASLSSSNYLLPKTPLQIRPVVPYSFMHSMQDAACSSKLSETNFSMVFVCLRIIE